MALTPGTRLGPYEVLAKIGAGGMGEVYKARDTRLTRTVAIKVLPADTADDAAAQARFEREARAIATLSHPHICVVHDVGRQDGTDYLVMELLEGETLAERLARTKGPLPLDHVLAIGIAIADALDKAHRAGIVHRDLKPGNVMLTKTGPKLLDFGLAKLRPSASPVSLSDETSETTAGPGTAKGTILGTVHYMAPEQLEGRDADARTDIWALGTLLYEMAAGQRPFEGDSAASIIGAILKDPPPRSQRGSRSPRRHSSTWSNGVSRRTPMSAGRMSATSSASSSGQCGAPRAQVPNWHRSRSPPHRGAAHGRPSPSSQLLQPSSRSQPFDMCAKPQLSLHLRRAPSSTRLVPAAQCRLRYHRTDGTWSLPPRQMVHHACGSDHLRQPRHS